MGKESIHHDGGGASSQQIVMNVDEMHEIMRYLTTIELSFQQRLAPKLQALSQTKYYEGGEASKALDHYAKMLNKVNEVSDLYSRANGEVFHLMNQWLEQDEVLAQNFRDSLQGGGQLADNLRQLFPPEEGGS